MPTPTPSPEPESKPRRVTQGEIIMALLTRGSAGGSSVTIARNAKGETQYEVVVRAGSEEGIETVGDALEAAQEVADALAKRYPFGVVDAA